MKKVLMAASAAFFACMSTPALSQACGDEQEVIQFLREEFNAHEQWRGGAGPEIEFALIADSTGGWAILMIKSGTACIVASGDSSTPAKGA